MLGSDGTEKHRASADPYLTLMTLTVMSINTTFYHKAPSHKHFGKKIVNAERTLAMLVLETGQTLIEKETFMHKPKEFVQPHGRNKNALY